MSESSEITKNGSTTEAAKRGARAREACTVCHRRKVRCNMGIVGIPCSNCFQDGTDCVLHISARGKRRRVCDDTSATSRTVAPQTGRAAATNICLHEQGPIRPTSNFNETPTPPSQLPLTPEATVDDQDGHVTWAEHLARPVQHESHLEAVFVKDFLRSWGFTASDRLDCQQPCGPHLWIPQRARKPLSDAEVALLDEKGALQLPARGFCKILLESYFTYVHPLLPVVEMTFFWKQYELQQPRNVSILLLQSMFLAASNYIPCDVYQANGFPSAALMKEVFYERSKVLFDMGFEQDKTVLAQSAILLSHWYGNAENIAVCWYWIGVASSLCQDMGLHRNPAPAQVPESRRRLWRRIWWCCYHRDRWIALGLGRPMRINHSDCDVEVLKLSDLDENANVCVGLSHTATTSIETYRPVAHLFLQAVTLSICLGQIMECHFGAGQNTISMAQSAECEVSISRWSIESEAILYSQQFVEEPRTTTLLKHVLNSFYQVVNIALYRSRLSDKFEASSDQDNISNASSRCWIAASAATDSLRLLIDLEMIPNLPPEMSTALVIITSVLFTQRFWTTGLREKVVTQKLDLCLMVMKELAGKYFAARSSLAYFKTAFKNLESGSGAASKNRPHAVPADQTQGALVSPPFDAVMVVSTSMDDFPSPSQWLYDLSCPFPTDDLLRVDPELV